MRTQLLIPALIFAACGGSTKNNGDGGSPDAMTGPPIGASVLQLHEHANRDGVYTDAAFTAAAVKTVHRVTSFDGSYAAAGATGRAYAQALFVDNGGAGDVVIVALESNDVIAFDATSGAVKWHTGPSVLGDPAPNSALSCGNIDPSGITGTPVIDLGTRAIFFQTDVLDAGNVHHRIHSLSIDDGQERAGWPIDMDDVVTGFEDKQEGERGALVVLGDHVYVAFGGRYGDCTPYHGYVIGLPLTSPQASQALVWKTATGGGGIWSAEGLSSDGASIIFATGNAEGDFPTDWNQAYSEGVFRLPPSLAFSPSDTTRWFAPSDWHQLDLADTDIGGSGVLVVDAPGITPSKLLAVLGKDSKLYLLDATNLGGIGAGWNGSVASSEIINAPASYTTSQGTYVAFRAACPNGGPTTINAVKIAAGGQGGAAWCAGVDGGGSPIVTTTGGGKDTVVWFLSAEGEGVNNDNKLHAFDGDTGQELVATEAISTARRFVSPIVAKGHIYVATDDRVYAFTP